jgi:hypothetical protein
MHRVRIVSLCMIATTVLLLGFYELTAKSHRLLDQPLPGWWKTQQVESLTAWNPSTGIHPLDKLIHEGEEAVRYYGLMIQDRS